MAIHSKFENKWINLELIEAVLTRGPEDATLRLVLLVLIYRQRRNPSAFMSRATLARDIARCERTTRTATATLEEMGWITIGRGRGEGGSNRYTVHDPQGAAIHDMEKIAAPEIHDSEPGNSRQRPRQPTAAKEWFKNTEEEYPPIVPQSSNAPLPLPMAIVPQQVAGGLREGCESVEDEFREVWQHYPRKVGTGKAREAWAKARRRATFAEIAAPLARWIGVQRGTPIDKIPHFSTWLNQERWKDDQNHARNRAETTSDRLARLGAGQGTEPDGMATAIRKAPVVELRIAK